MKKFMSSLPAKLLLGIVVGIVIGLVVPESVMTVLVPVKNIMGQIISFIVPLIVIGFIAPSITKLGNNATKLLGVALILAYVSSVLAALLSMTAGYVLIPVMNNAKEAAALKELPADVFGLTISPIMSVMSALAFSVMIGLAAVWMSSRRSFWIWLPRSLFPFCPSSLPVPSHAWLMRAPSLFSCPSS